MDNHRECIMVLVGVVYFLMAAVCALATEKPNYPQNYRIPETEVSLKRSEFEVGGEKDGEVYTRTIIRPVAYSFFAASVNPQDVNVYSSRTESETVGGISRGEEEKQERELRVATTERTTYWEDERRLREEEERRRRRRKEAERRDRQREEEERQGDVVDQEEGAEDRLRPTLQQKGHFPVGLVPTLSYQRQVQGSGPGRHTDVHHAPPRPAPLQHRPPERPIERTPSLAQSYTQNTGPFPRKTVLAANSFQEEGNNYNGLVPAVQSYSAGSSLGDGVLVTHSSYSGPAAPVSPVGTADWNHVTTDTVIANHPAVSQPQRVYSASYQGESGGGLQGLQYRGDSGGGGPGFRGGGAQSFARVTSGHGAGGGGGGHHEASEGSKHSSEHHQKKGSKGDKGYHKEHNHEKAEKGHKNNEGHSGEYGEEGGKDHKSYDEKGGYGEQHKQEKGGKEKKYGEGGKHKKGHTTHGEHNVVKKDEYIKSTKFYDEDHDGGSHEEHGAFAGSHSEKKGGSKKGGQKHVDYHNDSFSKKGKQEKGHQDEAHAGHESAGGQDAFFEHEDEYSAKKGGEEGKKWAFKNGGKH